jgi:hypothetical protein
MKPLSSYLGKLLGYVTSWGRFSSCIKKPGVSNQRAAKDIDAIYN